MPFLARLYLFSNKPFVLEMIQGQILSAGYSLCGALVHVFPMLIWGSFWFYGFLPVMYQ